MENSTRRVSSRIRKPTFKLAHSELGTRSVPNPQKEKNDVSDGEISKDLADQQNESFDDHTSETSHELKILEHCEDSKKKVSQKNVEKPQAVTGSNFEVETRKANHRTKEKSGNRDKGILHREEQIENELKNEKMDLEEKCGSEIRCTSVKNDAHDLNTVKKCMVKVLLKSVTKNENKSGVTACKKEAVSKTGQQIVTERVEKNVNNSYNSRKRKLKSNYSVGKTLGYSEITDGKHLDDISQEGEVFKEDGSFLEKTEPNARIESNECIKVENIGKIDESSEVFNGNDMEDEDIPSDLEAQIKIEFDELAETAEMDEVDFDFEDGKTFKSLECPICFKVLSSRGNLSKHMALHRADKPFKCEICGMQFALQAYLTIHGVVHSGKRKHKCDVCGKCFLRRSNLNSHRLTHTDIKAFSCDTCDKKFKTKAGRDNHTKEHFEGQGYRCDICGKTFNQQSYLYKHISVHKGEKPFKCTVCGKCFPYNQSLQEHMRIHTGEKPEVCEKCGKGFNNKRQLKVHMKYHNAVSEFACEQCSMFYDSQQSLNKHITKSHNRKHGCEYCNQTFVNKKHLRSHQALEHKDLLATSRKLPPMNLAKARKVECTLCKRVFFNRYVLSKHLMSKHQLSEKDMKDMLQIRKKALNKKQMESVKVNENKDFSKILENDKGFRIYYKDDEMAVYVKGTDNLEPEARVSSEKYNINDVANDAANDADQNVSYVVFEETNDVGANDFTEYTEITTSGNSNEIAELTDSVLQSIQAFTEEEKAQTSGTADSVLRANMENTEMEGQNYYVVFTDSDEKAQNTVKVLDNEFVSQAEIHSADGDETERIVLILNEAENGKNIVLEPGEKYEIVTDNNDVLQVDSENLGDEYEVVASGPVTPVEMNYQESFEHQTRNATEANNDDNTFNPGALKVSGHNLPMLEQLQTQDTMQQQNVSVAKNREKIMRKETYNRSQTVQQLTSGNEASVKSAELQHSRLNISENLMFAEGDLTVKPLDERPDNDCKTSAHNDQVPSYAGIVASDSDLSRTSVEELVPKSNTAQDFTNFENAVKSKVGDFQTQKDYNDFLDKMIQTLQKAKHCVPE